MNQYLKATYYFDYSHPNIQNFLNSLNLEGLSLLDQAIKLYYLVRDDWSYSPYGIAKSKEGWKASFMIQKEYGHCLDKSILMIALARARGIPARLHLAKVTNHIAVEQLIEQMGTNELTPHGYVSLYLNNNWVKATPAFNKELCVKLNVEALEFDGATDSIFQQFSKNGASFMEYIEDYGSFEDVPLDFIYQNLKQHYPHLVS